MTAAVAIVAVLALCGIGILVAVLHPLVVLCMPRIDAARRARARRHAISSAFILACAIAALTRVSLAGHALNVLTVVAALLCMGALTRYALRIESALVRLPIAIALLAWPIVLVAALLVHMNDGPRVTALLGNGLVCLETEYGYFGSDPGTVMDIYRRYLFIDHRIYRQINAATDPNVPTPAQPGLADAPEQCRTLIGAAHHAASR